MKSKFFRKEDPKVYQTKDADFNKVLGVRDFLALGVGTIVSTSIFTLPGLVAARHAGPAVTLSFLFAAIIAALIAFAYAEMASTMPFAGSAYSWISVIFGHGFGWLVGWALLAEYFIAVAFVAAGISANFRELVRPLGLVFPEQISNPFGVNGGIIDIFAVVVIVAVMILIARGAEAVTKVETPLVIAKVIGILVFVAIGIFYVKMKNFVPFVPKYEMRPTGPFGGWQGIWTGVSMIFLSYIGFDSIAANSAEAKDPKKTMPRGILGSLLIAVILFSAVSLVLVGMFKYSLYENQVAPVGWALSEAGHPVIAMVIEVVAVVGMLTALIGMSLAGSRLLYAFGRDKMLPEYLGKLKHGLPNNALFTMMFVAVIIGTFFPFEFLAQLMSACTIIAFMFVCIGIYGVRPREGKDLPVPGFKMPFYPVLPALAFIGSLIVLVGLDTSAKIYLAIWVILGILVYYLYGERKAKK